MTSPVDTRVVETKEDKDVIFDVNSQTQLATPPTKLKVYKYRWVILGLFMVCTAINGFQWIQYSIISNVVQQYYGVKSVYVDWMTIVFMFAYLPFNYPAMWLLDKKGLRLFTILGAASNCLAAWIKVVSVRPDLFYVTFIGQTVAGTAQVFNLNVPSRLAAVWFGQDQVSTACSLAVLGCQLGVAFGFLMPPVIVKPHDEIDDIGSDLSTMCYSLAGICSVQLILIILFFRDEPKLPPSPGAAARESETPAFVDSLKRLSKNRGFVLLTILYGVIIGVFGAISTLLNQMVLTHFPGHEEDAGRIGLTIMLAGMVGSAVIGYFLDKTHKFKETALGLYAFTTVLMLAFTFILQTNLGALYGVSALLGFFMTAFHTVGYEFAAEITYPEPEGTTAGLINSSSIIFSVLLTALASSLVNAVGDVWSNVTLTLTLVIGTILTALIKQDLRRQAAHALGEDKSS